MNYLIQQNIQAAEEVIWACDFRFSPKFLGTQFPQNKFK